MTSLEELKRFNEQLGEPEFKAKWVRLIFTNNETRMPQYVKISVVERILKLLKIKSIEI